MRRSGKPGEPGRRNDLSGLKVTFEPTDLAGDFRSANDIAGLRLTAECPLLTGPVFVDRLLRLRKTKSGLWMPRACPVEAHARR